MKVIFICTVNIFRSVSGEYLFRKYLKDMKDNNYEVSSAGIAVIPLSFYRDTKERLEFYGLDVSKHKQTQVAKEILEDKDFIICMTQQHMNYVINLGFSPILFNKIAYNNDEDLLDDCEYTTKYGHMPNEREFIYHTIDYINDAMPNIYKWIKRHSE